ncbi:MAG: hemolysin family protein [Actinomycetes bacterium]
MTASDFWLLVLAALLVVAAAILSGADAAVSRVSRHSVDAAARDQRRGARRLQQVVADPARYLNVALFLRIGSEITATVLVTLGIIDLFAEVWQAVVVTSAIMVVTAYVLIGVAPRTLGRQHATRIALALAPALHALASLLSPLTRLLILVGNALTPGKGFPDGPFTSEAELRDLVDLAEERSLIADDERQMIHSVFELGDTIAREVMVPRTDMVFIERGKTLRQALSLGLRSGFSRIPVIGENEDDVVGVVYLKDVTRRAFDHRQGESTEKVESLMRTPYFVPDSKPVDELLKDMQARRTHIAIAIDEYGGVAGLVTIEDILEEIVGEIADEYDTEERPSVERLDESHIRVTTRLHVEDFAELLDVELEEDELDDVDTVAGLLARRLGKVPIPGAVVELNGWQLLAESTAGRRNRVETVLATRLPDVDADPQADEERRSGGSPVTSEEKADA